MLHARFITLFAANRKGIIHFIGNFLLKCRKVFATELMLGVGTSWLWMTANLFQEQPAACGRARGSARWDTRARGQHDRVDDRAGSLA
jgi:hypothetical protein